MAFSMEVADSKAIEEKVINELQVMPKESEKLHEQADINADELMNCDLDSLAARKQFIKSIEEFGMESMQQSSSKNALLKVSIGKLSQSGDDGGQVAHSLMDLRREIKDLDPSVIDFTKQGVLGKIFNPIRNYFEKYEKSESFIADIVESLDKGKATLKNDNTTLEIEEQALREITKKIYKEVDMGSAMDSAISARIDQAKAQNGDPDRIKFAEEEVLFPLRQRIMDMQQMVVVNQQGIIAMEIIRRNNNELMRGVDRAKTVTVSALRTAVMVASALYDQRIVLKKIEMLNETTDNLIGSTSRMLKEQGAEIQKQSMQTGMSVETLKASFNDLMEALDSISTYKQTALPVMQQTIEQFRALADKGEAQVRKLEEGSKLMLES